MTVALINIILFEVFVPVHRVNVRSVFLKIYLTTNIDKIKKKEVIQKGQWIESHDTENLELSPYVPHMGLS